MNYPRGSDMADSDAQLLAAMTPQEQPETDKLCHSPPGSASPTRATRRHSRHPRRGLVFRVDQESSAGSAPRTKRKSLRSKIRTLRLCVMPTEPVSHVHHPTADLLDSGLLFGALASTRLSRPDSSPIWSQPHITERSVFRIFNMESSL